MTGKEAVELLAREPGYFIVGISGRRAYLPIGDRLNNFAGQLLPSGQALVVESKASREEWLAQQIQLFGEIRKSGPGHYYRCRLDQGSGDCQVPR